jgi:DNA-binding MarR family transcriptional regulator
MKVVPVESSTSQFERTALLVQRVSRALRDPQEEEWMTLDLSMAQVKILFALYNHGPATVGTLAGRLHVKLPTISATLDRLVRGGYVERLDDPSDRRVVINRLTARGSSQVERLREERRARVEAALSKLTPSEIVTLYEGLSALAEALGLARPAPVLVGAGAGGEVRL